MRGWRGRGGRVAERKMSSVAFRRVRLRAEEGDVGPLPSRGRLWRNGRRRELRLRSRCGGGDCGALVVEHSCKLRAKAEGQPLDGKKVPELATHRACGAIAVGTGGSFESGRPWKRGPTSVRTWQHPATEDRLVSMSLVQVRTRERERERRTLASNSSSSTLHFR